jgi:aromatic-L-amino-acid decarboxylase
VIGATIRKDVWLLLRDRGRLLMLFAMPVIFIGVFGSMFSGGGNRSKPRPIALWHAPGDARGETIEKALSATVGFAPEPQASADAVRTAVAKGDVIAGLIVPAPPAPVELSIDQGQPEQVTGPVQGALTGVVMRATLPAPVAALPPMVEVKTPPGIAKPLDDVSGFQVSVPGNAVLFGFFLAMTVAMSFASERTTGTWRRLLASPVPRWQALVGKMIPYYLIGCCQLGLLFGLGMVFGMKVAGSPIALVVLSAMVVLTPAAAVVEHVALRWVAELLELPAGSGALVTGAQMASFVGLAIARAEVLRAIGWDVHEDGLAGAPPVEIFVGAERHNTIDRALRMLGFGSRQLRVIEADREGRMRADRLDLAGSAPAIVCAQAGNVNGGAFDPLREIAARVADARGRRPLWLHLDGAFGLWARTVPSRRALVEGAEGADSWSTDAHKWLNTPYDCGIALVRDGEAHRRTFHGGASYLPGHDAVPNPFDHTPELSRRARGFALWAALRELGRTGVADLVERCCAYAGELGAGLAALGGVEVMNEVVLNQLVVRFRDPAGRDDDAHTRAVLARVIAGGACYPSATVWRGHFAMRISVSNWSTDTDDVRRTIEAIARAHVG